VKNDYARENLILPINFLTVHSTAALPAKKPRASGLYGTIPIPSSQNANKRFYDKYKGMI